MTVDPPLPPPEELPVAGETPLPEQPETDVTAPLVQDPASDNPANAFTAARAQLVSEIRGSRRLPRGLRERLAEAVEGLPGDDPAAAPSLRVTDALALLEESLPPQLVLAAETLEPAAHPGGDGFFTGDPRRFSAAEAARIAAEQLAATGFGKSAKSV